MKLSNALANEVATVNTAESVPASGRELFIAGFGLVDDDNLSSNLRGVFLDYVSSCSSRISSYNSKYHLCGDSSPSEGTCAGDSGSPVVITGTKTVVGLNSYSDNSCERQTIDVYTRVSTYSSWIAEQVCALSSDPPDECKDDADDGGGPDCWLGSTISSAFYNLLGWN